MQEGIFYLLKRNSINAYDLYKLYIKCILLTKHYGMKIQFYGMGETRGCAFVAIKCQNQRIIQFGKNL